VKEIHIKVNLKIVPERGNLNLRAHFPADQRLPLADGLHLTFRFEDKKLCIEIDTKFKCEISDKRHVAFEKCI
jgi:hypothetical protein